MDQQFWLERWDKGQIGFHREEVSPELIRNLPRFMNDPKRTVLVPLCGKSKDLLFLRDMGFTVIGIELSHVAVQSFWNENGIDANSHPQGPLTIWKANGITLLQGNFFEIGPHLIDAPTLVYDRAALIAMPPGMRDRYSRHLIHLAGNASLLMITLEYSLEEMQGPPFAVSKEEIQMRFGQTHTIEILETSDVLSENASLSARGLQALTETIYRMIPFARSA